MPNDVPYRKSIVTGRSSNSWTGSLAANRRAIPSSGWMRSTRLFGKSWSTSGPKRSWGGRRNWMAISVSRRVSRFPERR
jgi:hypothetical protein